ncbi:3030_t:CDS:10 [Funneliformis caledonium]|uniref:3030_t:CDS:1 n=1 Tax=Funneliformis caledonium TaxID=1117310 RepID=A0A9N9BQM6_9GLOM|nr:3030_t:CDS:10 [Funneliformis caledonium]
MKDNIISKELNTGEGKNRYKYQTFNLRVKSIKIDVSRRDKSIQDEPEALGSFFQESLESWKELNLTMHFATFVREVSEYCQSLPQLLYHKEKVVEILEKHLKVEDSLALEPLLDLTTKFAKDIEIEFYSYFERIFACIVPLTKHRDVNTLEDYLYFINIKFQQSLIAPLLGKEYQKPYIQRFAAESFAFLLRKAQKNNLTEVVNYIIESAYESSSEVYCRGLSMLFKTTISLLHYVKCGSFGPIWDLYLEEIENIINDNLIKFDKNGSEVIPETLKLKIGLNLSLIYICLTFRKGNQVNDFKRIFIMIQNITPYILVSSSQGLTLLQRQFFKICASLLTLANLDDILGGKVILDKIFEYDDVDAVLSFSLNLSFLKCKDYTKIMLPYIIRYSTIHWEKYSTKLTLFLANLFFTNTISISSGTISSLVTKNGLIRFPKIQMKSEKSEPIMHKNVTNELINIIKQDYDWYSDAQKLSFAYLKEESSCHSEISLISAALTIIHHLTAPINSVINSLSSLIKSLLSCLQSSNISVSPLTRRPFIDGSPLFLIQNLLGQAIETLTIFVKKNCENEEIEFMVELWRVIIDEILIRYGTNEMILKGIAEYLEYIRLRSKHSLFHTNDLERIYPYLKSNFSSFKHHRRLYSFKILKLFDQFHLRSEENFIDVKEPCEIFAMALKVEEVETNICSYREKTLQLRKLNTLLSSKRVPEFYADVIPLYCFGLLTINFSAIWPDAINALVNFSQVDPRTFWKLIHDELSRFENESKLAENGFSKNTLEAHFDKVNNMFISMKIHDEPFDCPHLNKFNKTANESSKFFKNNGQHSLLMHYVSVCSPLQNEKIDHWNYYGLLIKTLTEVPHIVEQHSKQFVPFFLHFAESEYDPGDEELLNKMEIDNQNLSPVLETKSEDVVYTLNSENDYQKENKIEILKILEQSPKTTRTKMALFLKLFAKFKNPRSVYKSANLQNVYLNLLTIGDIKVQGLALECLFTWKYKGVTPYEDNLRNFVNEIKFRDELSTFSLNKDGGSIEFSHRAEIMPIVIRLLYGRMISRKGKSSASSGMRARRVAVLAALTNCLESELGSFVDLLLEPFTIIRNKPGVIDNEFKFVSDLDVGKFVTYRKQLGYLNFLEDILKQLGSYLLPFIPDMFKVVIYIVHDAQRKLMPQDEVQSDTLNFHEKPDDDIKMDIDEVQEGSQKVKVIRQLGLKRIAGFFKIRAFFDYQPYVNAMFESFISVRIPKLDTESTQAPSVLMELFAIWASRKEYLLFLVEYNKDVLPKVFACLSAKKVRESVVSKVLDIADGILRMCGDEMDTDEFQEDENSLKNRVLKPYVSSLLDNLEYVLLQSSRNTSFGKDYFSKREIAILSQIAGYIVNGDQAKKLVDLLLPYLRKRPQVVPEKTKADILQIVANFLHVIPGFQLCEELFYKYYNYISYEFSTLYSRDCRLCLVKILVEFSKYDESLKEVVTIIEDLNAFSTKRLDEPDFDRRLDAFNRINQDLYKKFNTVHWLPLLFNCLFFIQDPEELSIRNNSSFCITRFISRVVENHEITKTREDYQNLLIKVIFPAIKRGMKRSIELVRTEFLTILSCAIKKCPSIPQFSDMACLLFDDDEANFFDNVHHIQIHRRVRALKRFSNECANGKIKNNNLVQIFIPLIGHFIFEADRVSEHLLINETISTIGIIAGQLPWGQYNTLLKHYMKLIPKKPNLEKVLVRTIIAILDNFHFDVSEAQVSETQLKGSKESIFQKKKIIKRNPINEVSDRHLIADDDADEGINALVEESEGSQLSDSEEMVDEAKTRSLADRIHNYIVNDLLPDLKKYLTQHDNENITIRVPVALAITKLLRALPEISLRINLPGLLTTVCQILRSRQQDARDTTRNTLSKISTFLGPLYFSFIVRELQGALTRGYQLHILGYTLHTLLVNLAPNLQVGALDYCLQPITDIIINDIFGEVGKEKDTEEITGKIKEMKSTKSFGTFELLAKIIEFKNIGILLIPLKEIMRETQNSRVLSKIDDILRKISIGLNSNPQFDTKEMVTFCQGLISQNLDILKAKKRVHSKKSNMDTNFTVQLKRHVSEPVEYYDANSYRFVEFGLTIFLAALKRDKFDMKSEEQLELLAPFVDTVGNALYSKHPNVNILALKVMCVFCNLKIKSLDDALPVIVKQIYTLIRTSSTTNSELVQACFKLLTVIIRDRKKFEFKESQLTFLINLIRPDLEEPQRQGTTFSLIRAIISRKFVVPEIYDMMQIVTEIMITSQATPTRDLSRQLLIQFLLDYPQGRGRLKNHLNLLIKNLNYVFESGRQSVMEMLNLILIKFNEEVLMEYAEIFFLSLAMSLVNDDSNKCREMAGELIKILLNRMDEIRLRNIYVLLEKWFEQNDKRNLQRMTVQVYGLVIEAFGDKFKKHIFELLDILEKALNISRQVLEQLEEIAKDDDSMTIDNVDWELGYYALNTFTKLVKKFPSVLYSNKSKNIWVLIENNILFPHSWVRLSTCRLFGLYFSNINPETKIISVTNERNENLTKMTLRTLANKFCIQLKSEYLGSELATQIVKNLFFIGKSLYYLNSDDENTFVEDNEHFGDKEVENQDDDQNKDESQETNGDNKDEEPEYITGQSNETTTKAKPSLFWLFKKLSYQARLAPIKKEDNDLQRTSIYQWMAAMTTFMPPSDLTPYLMLIISPIYRFVNDETIKGNEIDNLKQFGKEILDLVQKRVGTTQFHISYNKIKQQVLKVRRERKHKKAIMVLVDPESAAKRKLQKNEMKRQNRKRKNAEFASQKLRYGVTKKRRTLDNNP